jgi:hypothetical protein
MPMLDAAATHVPAEFIGSLVDRAMLAHQGFSLLSRMGPAR